MATSDPHVLRTLATIKGFMLAGRAIFTLRNSETGGRFTYRIRQAKDRDGKLIARWYVDVLTGSDNTKSYTYLGWITDGGNYTRSVKSRLGAGAVSARGFEWLWRQIRSDRELPEKVDFWHEGRCGRCGRKLSVPESISTGLGPECASHLGVEWKVA